MKRFQEASASVGPAALVALQRRPSADPDKLIPGPHIAPGVTESLT